MGLRNFITWLMDLLFGYDFFISYSHDDGRNYPRRLYEKLTEIGFKVFLDTQDYHTGDDLRTGTKRRVRMSTKLVVIARPVSLESPWVLREVQEYLARGRGPMVIDINGSMKNTVSENEIKTLLQDHLYLEEILSKIDGDPSADCIEAISKGFRAVRQETLRLRAFGVVALVIIALSVLAPWLFFEVEDQRKDAEQKGRIAQSRKLAADAAAELQQNHHRTALLLAAESTTIRETQQGQETMIQALTLVRDLERYIAPEQQIVHWARAIDVSHDGALIVQTSNYVIHDSPQQFSLKRAPPTAELSDVARSPLESLQAPNVKSISSLAFSPSGNLVALGGYGTLAIWGRESGMASPLLTPKREEENFLVKTMFFSPNGQYIALNIQDTAMGSGARKAFAEIAGNSEQRRPAVIDVRDSIFPLEPVADARIPWLETLETIGFGANSNYVLCLADGNVVSFDLRTPSINPLTLLDLADPILHATISPDNTYLATLTWDTVALHGLPEMKPINEWQGDFEKVRTLAVSDDAIFLASGYEDGLIRAWRRSDDEHDRSENFRLNHDYISVLKFLKNGRLFSVDSSGRSAIWNLNHPYAFCEYEGTTLQENFVFVHPSLDRIATVGERELSVWKMNPRQRVFREQFKESKTIHSAAFHLRGSQIAIGRKMIDLSKTWPDGGYSVTSYSDSTVFDREGKLFYINDQFEVIGIDASSGNEVWRSEREDSYPSRHLAINSESTLLASGNWGGLRIYDLKNGKQIINRGAGFPKGVGQVNSLTFHPKDSHSLFVSFDDGKVSGFGITEPELIRQEYPSKENSVHALAVSPDGRILAASGLRRLLLWNVDDRTLIASIPFPSIDSMVFASNTQIVTGHRGRVLFCDLSSKGLIRAARSVANRPLSQEERKRFSFDAESGVSIDLSVEPKTMERK